MNNFIVEEIEVWEDEQGESWLVGGSGSTILEENEDLREITFQYFKEDTGIDFATAKNGWDVIDLIEENTDQLKEKIIVEELQYEKCFEPYLVKAINQKGLQNRIRDLQKEW
jgi:hypothetical protein